MDNAVFVNEGEARERLSYNLRAIQLPHEASAGDVAEADQMLHDENLMDAVWPHVLEAVEALHHIPVTLCCSGLAAEVAADGHLLQGGYLRAGHDEFERDRATVVAVHGR